MKDKANSKIDILFYKLSKNDYLTAEAIAEELGVSTKTARSRMAELNLLINAHGAQIISRPRYGYHLQIDDNLKWNEYIKSGSLDRNTNIGTPIERLSFIAITLLLSADYIKVSYFADKLYVSPQIISDVLKECEALFKYYNLKLIRKPYYGLKLSGSEFDKRNCIISRFPNEFNALLEHQTEINKKPEEVFKIVVEALMKHNIHLTELSLRNVAAYAYLAVDCLHSGQTVGLTQISKEEIKDREYLAATEILRKLEPEITDEEICYFSVYISAMRSNNTPKNHANIVITQEINKIVNSIFETINKVFGVDFTKDLRLYMLLAQHLISLDLRIRYHIPLNCDTNDYIQKSFPYAYAIANEALSVLAREYQTTVSTSEVDWLALIFATGLEDIQKIRKMNVLVVYQEGRASSQLLKYEIQKNYSEYVNDVKVCTIYELEGYNLDDIDYIFSTVNITLHTNVPILMVYDLSLFYRDSDIETELLSHRMSALDQFFDSKLFFTDIHGETKEEILYTLCQKISQHISLPEGFYDALLEREKLHSTDYCPMVAIPHPSNMTIENDIVAVAVLEKPVSWGRYQVQLIILSALSLENQEATQTFYEVTSHFIFSKKCVYQLLKYPSYSTLIGILSSIDIG